ncbi:putative monooxygenase [Paraphaeosphaeria sporulosa]|uniref:Putative monooxygenase n=1 Tax=Paraphaeosphaeria sporulosa TaxID=1460663 RepID=A0A177BXM9_9PLEO|nr:putative monooxygenase [Paraphaeosphaeria sporulosa]OAF99156.1 putative monooxygenase [Paraphaeosphaeria sporulosa]
MEHFDVVIVGAGWYGLIAAQTYLRLAPNTKLVILDNAASIGGVWSKEKIYPDLFAQVGHGLFEFSSYPMKKEGLSPDRYISGRTINNYLLSFAKDHDLERRTRLNTQVSKVERIYNDKWLLSLSDKNPVIADKIIYASGVSSDPYVPDLPKASFNKPIIHSSQLGSSLEDLRGPKTNRALVVGAAKSSYDAVFLLLKAGKQVDWVIREDGKGSGPLAIMPPRLMWVLNTVDVMATRALASFSPAILNTEGIWYKTLHRNPLGRAFTKVFWRITAAFAEGHAGYLKNSNALKLRPHPPGYGIFWCNSGLGLASVPHFWKTFHEGQCTVHRTDPVSFHSGDVVELRNGTKIHTDHVLLCTGWTANLSAFDEKLRGQLGLPSPADMTEKWKNLDREGAETVNELLPMLTNPPKTAESPSHKRPWRLYRRLISPEQAAANDRSIFFPGQIHSVYTPLVAEVQALWGIAWMLGMIDTPPREDMDREIAVWNAWTAKRYGSMGKRHAYSIYDYLAYIDTLCRELGIKTNRKSNPVAEMFAPYKPSDYNGLIDEFLAAQAKQGKTKRVTGTLGSKKSGAAQTGSSTLLSAWTLFIGVLLATLYSAISAFIR